MSTDVDRQSAIRASDAERDEIARMIQQATAEGRLTIEEADDRLARLFATKYRGELPVLVEDMPRAEVPREQEDRRRGRVPFPLAVHATIVAVWSALLIARWAASDAEFFWPLLPMFWFALSLLVHARLRRRVGARWPRRSMAEPS